MLDFIKNFDEVAPLALGLNGQVNIRLAQGNKYKAKNTTLFSVVGNDFILGGNK
jgi:hypothetical protein